MGITFRHQAAGAMIGAYAGGQASSRRRGQKYALNMLQQRQRTQATGAKRRAVAGKQAKGRWDDPLAQPELEGQDAITQRAQQRTRARKYRLGKDIPAEWQPKFTSQAEIEAKRKREREDEVWDRKEEARQGEADLDFRRKGIDQHIPSMPEHLVGTDVEPELKKLNEAERKARGDRTLSEEQREEAAVEIQAERERILKDAPPASTPMEEYNEGLRYQGPDGKVYEQQGEGEGWIPGHMRDGDFAPTARYQAEREGATDQAAQQKQQATKSATDMAKWQKEMQLIEDKIRAMDKVKAEDEDGQEGMGEKTAVVFQKQYDTLAKRRDALRDAKPTPPQAPVPQAPPMTSAQKAEAEAKGRSGMGNVTNQQGNDSGKSIGQRYEEAKARNRQRGMVDTSQVRTPERIAADEQQRAGQKQTLSPDGKYEWDGKQWVAR